MWTFNVRQSLMSNSMRIRTKSEKYKREIRRKDTRVHSSFHVKTMNERISEEGTVWTNEAKGTVHAPK